MFIKNIIKYKTCLLNTVTDRFFLFIFLFKLFILIFKLYANLFFRGNDKFMVLATKHVAQGRTALDINKHFLEACHILS